MEPDRTDDRPHIEELGSPGPAPPRAARGPGAGIRRWLPAVTVGGLAVALIAVGFLGPKAPPSAPEAVVDGSPRPPDRADGSRPPGMTPGVPADPAPPPTAVPAFVLDGIPLEDPFLLVGGRWVDLSRPPGASSAPALDSAGIETGCELEQPFLLGGGRIVCIREDVTRPPGSRRATYDLALVTLGWARAAPAGPWASPPPAPLGGPPPATPLRTLVGRRDLAFGDPVAIAFAPGAEADTLLLAWAVLEEDGYRVALDRYAVGRDDAARRTGSRAVLAFDLVDGATPSLGDLRVSVAPGGAAALVGVTFDGTGGRPADRRLVVVPIAPEAEPGRTLGRPQPLPDEVTANTAGRSPLREGDATCGGTAGEGWADDRMLYLLCPGEPSAVRRVALAEAGAGRIGATVVDEAALALRPGADARTFLGNGVVVDTATGRYYRWSPWSRTLWAVDLRAPAGWSTSAAIVLDGPDEIPPVAPPEDQAGPRPLLALDAARDRIYVLALDVDGRATEVAALRGSDLRLEESRLARLEPWASLALAPDGTLLYLATPPRGAAGAVGPRVAVEVLDAVGLGRRLYAGLLLPGAWDPRRPLIAR